MCLLIHHTPETSFSDEALRDFYDHNSDGFGVMFGDGKKIHVTKSLGSVEETIALYRDICEGRECVIHYRMKTHGNIDLSNCHPYRITDELWLAHNGVLSASNPIDKSMSDTWHMIEYILRPIAEHDVDKLFDTDFQDYLGHLIGSGNKFALCHADGRIAVINRDAGVEHFGAWLSNTYAWTTSKFGYKSASTYYSPGHGYYNGYYDNYFDYTGSTTKKSSATTEPAHFDYNRIERAAYNSWRSSGEHGLLKWVEQVPEKAKFLLLQWYDMEEYEADVMVNTKPEEATTWLAELFESSSASETNFN